MLGLILNETEIVNNILEGKEKLPSNSGKIIRIIIKNMILKNKNNEEIENIVINILEHTYGNNFNKAYWKKIIASMIKDLKSKNIKMIDIDNIKIYKEELETIKSLEDLKTEKIAFVLLVYAKINNIVNKFSDGKINIPITNILKESLLRCGNESKMLMSNLYKLKYIKQSNTCDNTSLKINYLNEQGELAFIIDDLRDYQPITWYLEYRQGIKYKKCEKCGKRFEVKSNKNTSQKKCFTSQKKYEKENKREINKKYYDKNKN